MGKVRKEYRLPEESVEIINSVKKEKNFKTDTEALAYILDEFKNKRDHDSDKEVLADLVVEKMQTKFKKSFDRIRLASTFSERYSYIILDAINTMLHEYDIRFLMKARGKTMHPVIQESEKAFNEIIERNKQIKDNEELKRG